MLREGADSKWQTMPNNKGSARVPELQGATIPVLDPNPCGVYVLEAHCYIHAVLWHAADWWLS